MVLSRKDMLGNTDYFVKDNAKGAVSPPPLLDPGEQIRKDPEQQKPLEASIRDMPEVQQNSLLFALSGFLAETPQAWLTSGNPG
jgi:hypothetical protein